MKKDIRIKKAFTLIELMLVIILISIVSYLAFSNFNINSPKKYKISLENIKEFMLKKFEYNDRISLSCFEDEKLNCYVFIDDILNKNIKIENLFEEIPQVYNYDKDLSDLEFLAIKIENIEYKPFFVLEIDKDKKHKNIVLDTMDERVYVYHSLFLKAIEYKSTNEILDNFNEKEIEVKDAL